MDEFDGPAGTEGMTPPAAPTPAPGTPAQPVGTRPAYATMVQQIRGRQGPRVS